jgi:hypothetical protein
MKATEIVEKLKEVLLGANEVSEEQLSEEVSAVEESTEEAPQEEVNLNEDEQPVEVEAEETQEVEANEEIYVTKEEFAQLKSMVEKMMVDMTAQDEKMNEDVPREELSAVEDVVEPMVHTPEETADVKTNLFSQKKVYTTSDSVFSKIAKIKK